MSLFVTVTSIELKDLRETNLDISHPIFGPPLNAPQSKKPQHSCAMSRIFLNRSVQIRPKSWRDFVQVIFFQVLRARATITSHFRIPPLGHLGPIFTRKILSVGLGYACGFAHSDRPNLTQTWARILGGYCFANPKDLRETNLDISHPIFGPALNLETAVGSQKSAQALGAT